MIETINKDILTVEKGVIAHCCNCLGVMGGFAGSVKKKWPIVFEQYKTLVDHHIKHDTQYHLLGRAQILMVGEGLAVANLFTQYDIGMGSRKTEYCAVNYALDNLRTMVGPDDDIYFPWNAGCNLGGGDPVVVNKIISDHFQFYNGKVKFCKL